MVELRDRQVPRFWQTVRQYVLVYNTPKPDVEADAIALSGERYPLVRRSPNEFEYTEILEVSHDG